MKPRHALGACALAALAAIAATVPANEPGSLMHITSTTRMQIPGLPNMAPMTLSRKVCSRAYAPDPRDMMSNDGQCTISDFKRNGSNISYHLACTGELAVTGEGRYSMGPDGSLRGSFRAEGTAHGQQVAMEVMEAGQRIGTCSYTPRKRR